MTRYLAWPVGWSVAWTVFTVLASQQQRGWEALPWHCLAAAGIYIGAHFAAGGGRLGLRSGAAWAITYAVLLLATHLMAIGINLEVGPSGPILLLCLVTLSGAFASWMSGVDRPSLIFRAGLACVVGLWIAAVLSYLLSHYSIQLLSDWLRPALLKGIAVALSGALGGVAANLLAGAGMSGGFSGAKRAELLAS